MAQIFAPGVAQLRLVGSVGTNPQAQVLHFYAGTSSAWTQNQIDILAGSGMTQIGAHLSALLGANVVYDFCEAIDLTDATERVAKSTEAAITGSKTAPWLALSASILVSHKIGARYRGGHPRTYFPSGNAADTSDGDSWTAAVVSAFQSAFDNFIAAIVTDLISGGMLAPVHCAPRYSYTYTADATKHKFIKERVGYVGPFPIVTSTVGNQIATQRRRLGG